MPKRSKPVNPELLKFLQDSVGEEYEAFDTYKEFSEFAKSIAEKEISKVLLEIAFQELDHANRLSNILSIMRLR